MIVHRGLKLARLWQNVQVVEIRLQNSKPAEATNAQRPIAADI